MLTHSARAGSHVSVPRRHSSTSAGPGKGGRASCARMRPIQMQPSVWTVRKEHVVSRARPICRKEAGWRWGEHAIRGAKWEREGGEWSPAESSP